MNPSDVLYLFSPYGEQDLKKIIQYHISPELNYSTNLIQGNEMHVSTLCKSETLWIKVNERTNEPKKQLPISNYIFTINKGESKIKYTDYLAKNGNVQVINSVLIPKCVVLPSMRQTNNRQRN